MIDIIIVEDDIQKLNKISQAITSVDGVHVNKIIHKGVKTI